MFSTSALFSVSPKKLINTCRREVKRICIFLPRNSYAARLDNISSASRAIYWQMVGILYTDTHTLQISTRPFWIVEIVDTGFN